MKKKAGRKILFLVGELESGPNKKLFKLYEKIARYLKLVKGAEVISNTENSFVKYIAKWEPIIPQIEKAECIIIEGSCSAIELGLYIFICIEYRKPVLFIVPNRFPFGLIKSHNFHGVKYSNELELPNIITRFLQEVDDKALSKRFNLFISDEQKDYLQEMGKFSKSGASDYLRSLIDQDIIRKSSE